MTFDEILGQVRALLRERRRVSYVALKRRFELSEPEGMKQCQSL